jgi:hypothetical protein
MSYENYAEITAAPGATLNDLPEAEAKPAPKKRTVRQFLNQYRSLGLPGHKKARRVHRIAQLESERDFMQEMVRRAAVLNARANSIIRALIDESNFALRSEGLLGKQAEENDEILWIADDTVLENARAYLKEFSSGMRTRSLENIKQPSEPSNDPSTENSVNDVDVLAS